MLREKRQGSAPLGVVPKLTPRIIDNSSSGWGPMSLPEAETLDSSCGPNKTIEHPELRQRRRGYLILWTHEARGRVVQGPVAFGFQTVLWSPDHSSPAYGQKLHQLCLPEVPLIPTSEDRISWQLSCSRPWIPTHTTLTGLRSLSPSNSQLPSNNPSPCLNSGQAGKPHCSQPAPSPQSLLQAPPPTTQLGGELGFLTQNDPFSLSLCRGPGYKELEVA